MKKIFAFFALAAIILAGATSCKDKLSKKTPKSIFVETRGVEVFGDESEFYAEMYALVANSIELTDESFANGDIGFEYSKSSKFTGEVTTVLAEDRWTDVGDPLERKGFLSHTEVLPPNEVFYYRAFLKKDGNMEYGEAFSFRTDNTMVKGVSLDHDEVTLTLGDEASIQLTATIDPPEALNQNVEWSTSNKNVATVSSTGLVTAVATGNATITVTTKEGGKTATCEVTVKQFQLEAVDLGLSVKWANINIGATKVADPGNYYRWGESSVVNDYVAEGYIFNSSSQITIPDSIEGGEYDTALAVMGSPWRMPTWEEMRELLGCQWTRETIGDMYGWRVTGSNGNSIYLPWGGQKRGTEVSERGEIGYYWSASKVSNPTSQASAKGFCLKLESYAYGKNWEEGHIGYNVRAVQP